jgi:hypothetical protein
VLFALMLFLVAMGERFKVRGVRIAANTVADGLLAVEGDPCSSFAAPPRFQAPRPRWQAGMRSHHTVPPVRS